MIALVEAIDRDGTVRQAWRVERWPLTIGRALDNDVVLSDPHVAAHHARIDAPGEGAAGLVVGAGETRNGVIVDGRPIAGGATVTVADSSRDLDLQVGRTTLRLRLASHALAPEQVVAPIVGGSLRWEATAALGLVVLAGAVFTTWLSTDPDNLARAIGTVLVSTVAMFALWCGAWALLSKIVARQGRFAWHVRVALGASVVLLALSVVPALLAFSLSWPWVTDFSFVAVYAVGAVAIYLHLLAVEPTRPRLMRGVVAVGFAVAVALSLWFNVQRTGRPGEELYMNHLFPPALRLARPKPVDALVDGLAPMQAVLDRQAKEKEGGGDEGPGENDDE